MLTDSRGEFSDLHTIFRLRALRYSHLLYFHFTLRDWLKKLVPPGYPIRYKTKPYCDSFAHFLPALRVRETCLFRVLIGSLYCLCPL